jgi:hypothetical protein
MMGTVRDSLAYASGPDEEVGKMMDKNAQGLPSQIRMYSALRPAPLLGMKPKVDLGLSVSKLLLNLCKGQAAVVGFDGSGSEVIEIVVTRGREASVIRNQIVSRYPGGERGGKHNCENAGTDYAAAHAPGFETDR